tara:strand:+ start:127491 stop:129482 length:1992 start_codon:yes stop_codon:yes gene_type:complete
MIGPSSSPTFKEFIQFLLPQRKKSCTLFPQSKKSPPLFFSRSSWAFWLVVKYFLEINERKNVKIAIPNYICNDFLNYLDDFELDIIFYPVLENLEPDWKWLEENGDSLDIFLLVHYFGHINNIQQAKKFCHKRKALFVEDASHLLEAVDEVGTHSDFAFYSPYKLLPVPDGSVLTYKIKNKDHKEVLSKLYQKYYRHYNSSKKWFLKKIIQLFIPQYLYENYIFKLIPFDVDPKQIDRTPQSKINPFALKYLINLNQDEIDIIKQRRIDNYNLLKYGLQLTPLLPLEKSEVPYFFDHVQENAQSKYLEFDKNRLFPASWPDLPESKICSLSQKLRKSLISIPIHQNIPYKKLVKLVEKKSNEEVQKYKIDWNCKEEEYRELFKLIPKSNLLQNYDYANAKAENHNDILRGIIYFGDKKIGVVQGIYKSLFGIKILRINRGPALINQESYSLINILKLIKKKSFVLLIAPEFSLRAYQYLMNKAFTFKWKKQTHQSVWVNLSLTEEDLRASLHSKWRNTLKAAEKNELRVDTQNSNIDELLDRYISQQKQLGFQGVDQSIIQKLDTSNSLVQFHAIKDDKKISSVVIAKHGSSCTYLIGWNSESGKALKANYLLLWNAIIFMKKEGFTWFDLGGIDEVKTPQITKFKKGISSNEYKLIGEFLSF